MRDSDQVATPRDAVREFVRVRGEANPDSPWIVSQYDSIEANPFYRGKEVPHPDEVCDEGDY